MTEFALYGTATLDEDTKSVGDGGLLTKKHRVELQREGNNDAWICELTVEGNLPWFRGESRSVRVRIMSKEFEDEVRREQPLLSILRGSQRVGELKFDALYN